MFGLNLPLALSVERVIDDELLREDVLIAQTKSIEAEGDPAQALARRMRICWVRVRGPDDFREQKQRRVGELVFLQDRIKRNILAVMSEFTALNVVRNCPKLLRFGLDHIGGHEQELGYFSLTELKAIRGQFGLGIERDRHFSPTPLSKLMKNAPVVDPADQAAVNTFEGRG